MSEALISNSVLSCALWIRSSPFLRKCPPGAYCPFCASPVSEWRRHMVQQYMQLVLATVCAVRALLDAVEALGHSLHQTSLWTATTVIKGFPDIIRLHNDEHSIVASHFGCTAYGLVSWASACPGQDNSCSADFPLKRDRCRGVLFLKAFSIAWEPRDQSC